jgi:hypothetical protein
LRILEAVGLNGASGLHDLRWFGRADLRLAGLEVWLADLEPYYYPCKARRFFYGRGDPSADWILLVLRHLLPLEGYAIKTQERVYLGQKQTLYQISPLDPFRAGADATAVNHTVDFT